MGDIEETQRREIQKDLKDYITKLILFMVPGSISTAWSDNLNWKPTLVAFLAWAVAAMPASILPGIRVGAKVAIRGIWAAAQISAVFALIWFGIGAVNHATDDMDRLYVAARMCENQEDAMNLDVCRFILEHDGDRHLTKEVWMAVENERISANATTQPQGSYATD